jgi:F-type H+-transporting ATPase subunit delta
LSFAFINLITDKRRESYIADISKSFIQLYKQHKNILSAVITSANGIDEATRNKVKELIKTTTQGEIELVEKVDKELIGGFVLKIGDKQIDASVSRQLNNLRKSFAENVFVKSI